MNYDRRGNHDYKQRTTDVKDNIVKCKSDAFVKGEYQLEYQQEHSQLALGSEYSQGLTRDMRTSEHM